jgi:endonuclease-3
MLHAHHWLILHGRYICKAIKPRCDDCLIADLCTSDDKVLTAPAKASAASERA